MKCQEVMIYMQRQLDGDLTPNEEDELHAHLMHCLDCAQMYERLQSLSDELSQLPKVKPPFSLVDAIMPQLLELDKQPVNPVVVPFQAASESMAGRKITKRSRIREQFSWKIASGVVAAGLIIGFFAFNMKHPVLDNADGIFNFTSSSSESKADRPSAATSSQSRALDSADIYKQELSTSNQAVPKSSMSDTKTKGKEDLIPQASAASGNQTQPMDAMVEKPSAYTAPISGQDALVKPQVPSTSAPEKMKIPTDSNMAKNATDTKDMSAVSGSATPTTTPNESNPDAVSKKLTPSAGEGFKIGSMASILPNNELQNPSILKSASGAYAASVEDAHVVIRNSQTLEIVFASKQVWQGNDEIKLIEWSKDDKLFYQVTSNGTIQTILIDVNAQTEANK
ncbi:zf-HC2 domain-containing protein [Paenibacillus roseipurpureus]|uniref:Anti-sigma-W factor RsiW n=1 Tax=Paenibacillus roseopurpureus TaxID=2918901 RepID=A0AA96LUN3_9BACL|nr:zf-HC2 domain-containing protein [Paenibacillus sp. MBLB1832]WNR46348.1 zf-HC2 domain-containing protein [Paenibacillus sp. MBLB1832]